MLRDVKAHLEGSRYLRPLCGRHPVQIRLALLPRYSLEIRDDYYIGAIVGMKTAKTLV